MRVVGIIAEYNPFHHGHAYHLREAREKSGADYVIAVMSTVFTQRGDAAILSPADRTRMALECGADAVFALPVMWSVRDAEHFALGGVSLLHSLGVDAISFGAETADLAQLQSAARLLEEPDAPLSDALQGYLSSGLPYPAALHRAVEDTHPETAGFLASPNNTLALCYLRAMIHLKSEMEVFPVLRTGSYHETSLTNALPSATALRGAILRGDWTGAERSMPASAFSVLHRAAQQNRLHRPEALDLPLLYRLRTLSDYTLLPDLSEGIEDRLLRAAQTSRGRAELILTAKTRRYPYARLSRLCTHALLGMTQRMLEETPLPPTAWLLGLRESARPLMQRLGQSGFPIIGKAADYDRSQPWFRLELQAYDVWATGAGIPAGLALRQGVVRI